MKRQINQQGSAHIIVIMLLVIALFATLGVVFYQNFIAKKDADQSNQPVVMVPTDTKKTARVAFNSAIYTFDYPKEWSEKTSTAEGIPTTVTSPDQAAQVSLIISKGGLGGACDANDGLKISYYKVHSTMVAKLTDQSLYTVEALTDAVGGGYQYTIGLTQDGGATHAAIGDSHCNVTPVGVAAASVAGSDAPTIIARIVFPKLTKDGAPVKEMQPVKDLIATDNYKAAVKVLESLRKE